MAEESTETQTQLEPHEILRAMNREFTETKADPTQKPPVQTPPTTTTEVVTPPGPTQTPPPATTPLPKKDQNYIPADPSFVRKPSDNQTTQQKDGDQPPVETPPPTTTDTDPKKVSDDLFYGRLSEMTEGYVKGEEDFVRLISSYNELVDQQQKGFEPQFPNARAKWAYELLQKNPGQELETAQRTIRAQSLEVDKMQPKDLLFEKFLLDPLNKKVATDIDKARKYFEADYSSRFNDLENNLNQQLILERETEQAKEQIAQIVVERQQADAPAQQQSQQAEQYIAQAAEGFGGIRLAFTDNAAESEFLNVPVEDPQEIARLQYNALNPDKWHAEFTNQFKTQNGFDWPGYFQARYEMENHVQLRQKAYDHGFKQGQMAKVQEHRNSTPPADIAKQATAPPAPKAQPKSMMHAWLDKVEGNS